MAEVYRNIRVVIELTELEKVWEKLSEIETLCVDNNGKYTEGEFIHDYYDEEE